MQTPSLHWRVVWAVARSLPWPGGSATTGSVASNPSLWPNWGGQAPPALGLYCPSTVAPSWASSEETPLARTLWPGPGRVALHATDQCQMCTVGFTLSASPCRGLQCRGLCRQLWVMRSGHQVCSIETLEEHLSVEGQEGADGSCIHSLLQAKWLESALTSHSGVKCIRGWAPQVQVGLHWSQAAPVLPLRLFPSCKPEQW